MLCLADRGLSGYPLWNEARQTGAHLLWRVTKNRPLPVRERLCDGSYLSEIEPAKATRKTLTDPLALALTVRVIDYRLPGLSQSEPIYRLITTLLNPDEAPANELAALARSRTVQFQARSHPHPPKTPRQWRPSPLSSSTPGGIILSKNWRKVCSPTQKDDPTPAWSSDGANNFLHARGTNRLIKGLAGLWRLLSEQHWVRLRLLRL
jgi:hypothetical protein